MDNNQPVRPGSFMTNAGGQGSAILAAMQRRGITPGNVPGAQGSPLIPNVPSGSPSAIPEAVKQGLAQPPTAPPQPPVATPQAPQMAQPTQTGQPVAGQAMPPGAMLPPMQSGNPQAEQILDAMSDYLKSLANINEAQAGVQ